MNRKTAVICRDFLRYACLAAFLLLASPASARESPDQVARSLAGLPQTTDSAGFSGPEFARFSQQVEQSWQPYLKRIGNPIAQWAEKELPACAGSTLFYPFSGPDLPTPVFLRPAATRYILVANQRAGEPVTPSALSAGEASRLLQKYQAAWKKFGHLGFFLTNDLMRDTRPNAREINPTGILMAFAARLGFTVEAVQPVRLGSDGEVEAGSAADWSSVRLILRRNETREQVLVDYVYMDLSDAGLDRHPDNQAFIRQSSRHPVLFKAASHLPQSAAFTHIRQAVVNGSSCVIQDETGIDYGLLKEKFQVRLYGNFTRPHQLFPGSPQRSLAKAYSQRDDVRPLGFRIGYEKASGSALMVALAGGASGINHLETRVSQNLAAYEQRERVAFVALGDEEGPYRDYLARLRAALLPAIQAAQAGLPAGKSLVLGLHLKANGKIGHIEVVRGSGNKKTDEKILAGFSLPTALPALPAKDENLQVIFKLARE